MRVGELLVLDDEWADEVGKIELRRVRGELRLENVSFSYDRYRPVLQDITLRMAAGSTVALVGESGSGKTTLCRLLLRFHEPDSGQIFLDDINLRTIHLSNLRSHFGWVDQESQLLPKSIAENIAIGHPGATREEVTEAARRASIDEFVNRLPEGYETRLGDLGGCISGGERQRLCIARALVGDPPILVLDEATSHLDSKSERAIQRALEAAGGTRTQILIAHRLSTVVNADLIVVMRGGRIVEHGTHERLIANASLYSELWDRQTQSMPKRMLEAAS
jgi:ABC-type multidrug transport system fused ATPase/permease subunit